MNNKKARMLTSILMVTGIVMPIAGMFLILRSELIAAGIVISFLEITIGAILSARLYNCDDILDDTGEEYL